CYGESSVIPTEEIDRKTSSGAKARIETAVGIVASQTEIKSRRKLGNTSNDQLPIALDRHRISCGRHTEVRSNLPPVHARGIEITCSLRLYVVRVRSHPREQACSNQGVS